MRRCTVCLKTLELVARNFAPTKRGFAYVCRGCKCIDMAIRYRRKTLAVPRIRPFAEQERKIFVRALAAAHGDVTQAAKLLQVGRATIYRKMADYKAAGQWPEQEIESSTLLRKELGELEEKWNRMIRRARIIRRREKRKAAFVRHLDHVLDTVRSEREALERAREKQSLDRSHRHDLGKAPRPDVARRPRELPVVAL